MSATDDKGMSGAGTPPGHLVRRLHQISVSLFNQATVGFDLTPVQSAALLVVARTPGVDITSLARRIACDRSTIGPVVDRLAAKKLIERRDAPDDRRKKLLFATDAGIAVLDDVRPRVRRSQEILLEPLSDRDKEELVRIMSALIDHHGGWDDAFSAEEYLFEDVL